MKRRAFVGTIAAAGVAPQIKAADATPDSKSTAKDVTRTLARYVVSAKYEDLPAAVRKEAQRTLLNWAGCAIGGSGREAVGLPILGLPPFVRAAQGCRLGRKDKTG